VNIILLSFIIDKKKVVRFYLSGVS